ncbi:hypothetical protein [Pseudomonas sp. M47T1]|nr:hypothetical protein [Pseudomonas sp. M47T1]
MLTYLPEKSFVATVKCTTPGFEGFWDRHEVEAHPGGDEFEGARLRSSHLVLNNFYSFPDVGEEERCRFFFKCYVQGDGPPVYKIWVRDGDRYLQLDVTREFGALRFYPTEQATAHWHIYVNGEPGGPAEEGTYQRFSIRSAMSGIPWTYLGQRRRDGKLTPTGRRDSGKYWHAYVDADGGPRDAELIGDLHVLKLG